MLTQDGFHLRLLVWRETERGQLRCEMACSRSRFIRTLVREVGEKTANGQCRHDARSKQCFRTSFHLLLYTPFTRTRRAEVEEGYKVRRFFDLISGESTFAKASADKDRRRTNR